MPAAAAVSDCEVVAEVKRLARCECEATAALVACLVELDARQLPLREGFPSLFAYCVDALHLTEGAAVRVFGSTRRPGARDEASPRPPPRPTRPGPR